MRPPAPAGGPRLVFPSAQSGRAYRILCAGLVPVNDMGTPEASTNVADARVGLGISRLVGDAGDAGTGAAAPAGAVGVGVERVVLGIPLNNFRAQLCSGG